MKMGKNSKVDKLKILMVCPQFHPLVGGYERSAKRLGAELVKRGHDVAVITERRNKNWDQEIIIDGVTIYRFGVIYKRGLHQLSMVPSLALSLFKRGRKRDVIHVHQIGTAAVLCMVFGGLFGIPVLVKTTSTGVLGIVNTVQRMRFSMFTHWLCRRFASFTYMSNEMKLELEQLGIDSDVSFFLPNGIDTEFFSPLESEEKFLLKRKLDLSAKTIVIYVARFAEPKNPFLALRAWASVERNSHEDNLFVMIGFGPLEQALRAFADEQQLKRLRILGRKDDVRQYYQAADIFVLSSNVEGLSNSMLEALGCGLAVITTAVSGARDIVGTQDVGLVVDINDVDGFSAAISRLLLDESYRGTCQREARRLAIRDYSIESVVEAAVGIYSQLSKADH